MKAIDCNELDQFETEKSIIAGSWEMWPDYRRRAHIRTLVREAHKGKYKSEDSGSGTCK